MRYALGAATGGRAESHSLVNVGDRYMEELAA